MLIIFNILFQIYLFILSQNIVLEAIVTHNMKWACMVICRLKHAYLLLPWQYFFHYVF